MAINIVDGLSDYALMSEGNECISNLRNSLIYDIQEEIKSY